MFFPRGDFWDINFSHLFTQVNIRIAKNSVHLTTSLSEKVTKLNIYSDLINQEVAKFSQL